MIIQELLEDQLRKLEKAVSKQLAQEIYSSIEYNLVTASVQDKTKLAFADMRPHSDYFSAPNHRFGVSVTVVPCTLPEARDHFIRQNPEVGFADLMFRTFQSPTIKLAHEAQGTIGIVFFIFCISPNNENPSAVSTGLMGRNIPWIFPAALVPTEFIRNFKAKSGLRINEL